MWGLRTPFGGIGRFVGKRGTACGESIIRISAVVAGTDFMQGAHWSNRCYTRRNCPGLHADTDLDFHADTGLDFHADAGIVLGSVALDFSARRGLEDISK
jgi:hypothetical protein